MQSTPQTPICIQPSLYFLFIHQQTLYVPALVVHSSHKSCTKEKKKHPLCWLSRSGTHPHIRVVSVQRRNIHTVMQPCQPPLLRPAYLRLRSTTSGVHSLTDVSRKGRVGHM